MRSRYPSLDAINTADHYQICSWYRFLPSPGSDAIARHDYSKRGGDNEVNEAMDAEAKLMDRIAERLKEFGGFTPEISKSLGW